MLWRQPAVPSKSTFCYIGGVSLFRIIGSTLLFWEPVYLLFVVDGVTQPYTTILFF